MNPINIIRRAQYFSCSDNQVKISEMCLSSYNPVKEIFMGLMKNEAVERDNVSGFLQEVTLNRGYIAYRARLYHHDSRHSLFAP